MFKALSGFVLPLLVIVTAACAARGARPSTYNLTAGSATVHDIVHHGTRILNRHQFEIQRVDSNTANLIIETRWRSRYPFPDEIDGGVMEAMTKLTINARRVRRISGGGSDVRRVHVVAQNRVLLTDSLSWTTGFMTPRFKNFVDQIVDELRIEFESGIRVF